MSKPQPLAKQPLAKQRTYAEVYLKEKRINLQGCRLEDDQPFIEPHKYRTIRQLPVSAIVAAAWAAVEARRGV